MVTIRKGASMMERAERNAEQFKTITAKDVAFPYSAASADKLNADMYIACLGYADESHRAEMDEVAGSGIDNAYAIFSNATEHFRTVYRAMMIDHSIRNSDGTMFPVDRFGFPDIGDYLDGCFLRLTTPVEGTVNQRLGIPSWHGLIPESEGGTVICSAVVESDGTKYGLQPYGLMTEWDEFRVIANLCAAGYEQGIHNALRGIRNVLPELGYLPNPSGIQTLTRVLTSGGNPRNSAVTRSEKWEIVRQDNEENPNASTVTYTRENRGEKQVLTITNPDMFFPGTDANKRKRGTIVTRKLLPFVLQKMVQQGYPDRISIDLIEMVNLGMYSTEDSAYRALTRFTQQMSVADISWESKGRGKKRPKTAGGGVIFYHRSRSGGSAYIYVNQNIDLTALAQMWTVFPRWAYGLSAGPFDLVRYIFFIARQRADQIHDNGRFNISLQVVAENMGLPAPEDVPNRKYREKIRKPIEDAIDEIEQRVAATPEAKGKFFITPYADETTTDIDVWLQGYIEVMFKDEYIDTFSTIAQKKKALVEQASQAQKRKS